jgi:hypothetical protein
MEDFKKKIENIAASAISEQEKLAEYIEAMAYLKPIDNAEALVLACSYGIASAQKVGRPEMEAQFYMTRAKVTIMGKSIFAVREMKDITMAPRWFQFALESEKKRYEDLDAQYKKVLEDVQSDLNKGFEAINKNRIEGAVAFCLKTVGEIYGQHYLQLKLYLFDSDTPLHAKLANLYISRWFGIDDYLFLTKAGRNQLKQAKKDCLGSLYQAKKIFEKSPHYDYLADALLALASEHSSFYNPIRARFYMLRAERLIKKHHIVGLEDNLRLIKNRRTN